MIMFHIISWPTVRYCPSKGTHGVAGTECPPETMLRMNPQRAVARSYSQPAAFISMNRADSGLDEGISSPRLKLTSVIRSQATLPPSVLPEHGQRQQAARISQAGAGPLKAGPRQYRPRSQNMIFTKMRQHLRHRLGCDDWPWRVMSRCARRTGPAAVRPRQPHVFSACTNENRRLPA